MEYNTYNSEDNTELRRLQLTVLEIIRLFKDICDRHHLRYFMIGGTMLGAVRHKGFIPWDDDVDLGMPRKDYEQFLKIVEGELPDGYAFLNYKKNPDYHRYFSRIVNENVKIYNDSNSVEIVENAWIDIFPFDGMPKGALHEKAHFWLLASLRLQYHMSCFDELVNLSRPGRPAYQQAIIDFLKVTKLGRNMDTLSLMRRIECKLRKYSFDEADRVVNFFGAYMEKEVIDKSLLGTLPEYPFEDLKLPGAEQFDPYLAQFYGDWRTPPADADKDKHSIRRIEYTDGE